MYNVEICKDSLGVTSIEVTNSLGERSHSLCTVFIGLEQLAEALQHITDFGDIILVTYINA